MFAHRTSFVLALFFVCLFVLSAVAGEPTATLPRMIDLGAGKCIPCKKMAPILEEMKKDYAGVVDVVFLDVWKDPKAGKPYKIRLIPTQIFFDKSGQEVFRHEGFFSREEIEKVFLEKMGVKPIPPSQKKEEKKSSGSLLRGSWGADSVPAMAGSRDFSDAVG
jgi:thioredoxin 1